MVTTYQPSKKVLIVDDDSSIRETLSNFLSSKGFRVESAENGYTALKVLQRSPFDFLIVDVDMPKINGIELLSYLKEWNINIPSIIITGNISEEIRKEASRLKVWDVIEKPFSFNDIFLNIQQGLDKTELLNQK